MEKHTLTLADVATKERQYLETIFAIGDGHFGVRDSIPFTGSRANKLPVMLVNGFFETNPIVYGESAYGYAKEHQTIVSLASPRNFDLATSKSSSAKDGDWSVTLAQTELDFETGELRELYDITTVEQEKFRLAVVSIVSLDGLHQIKLSYQLTSLNYEGELRFNRPLFVTTEDGANSDDDPRIALRKAQLKTTNMSLDKGTISWNLTTGTTNQTIAERDAVVELPKNFKEAETKNGFSGHGQIEIGQTVTFEFVRQISEIDNGLNEISKQYDFVLTNTAILKEFWQTAQIKIDDTKLQKGIQYNLFQLYQSAGKNGLANIAAKGITGPGYEGHYFWDTEMYMLPFFIYTQPQIAKQLLSYRYRVLPQARKRARELGVTAGALFAWRTINGEEASAYYPAGTAQYHINADIAHAIKLYFDVTGDEDFLQQKGALVVLETARFWLAYGSWSLRDGHQKFCLYKVTGPDEYTALVDNNYYTNRLAKENLAFAAWLIKHGYLTASQKENALFEEAANNMYLPYDQQLMITEQDDESPAMPTWPFETTPATKYPLLLNYHPLMIYRHRVNKQADTLLAEMLFPNDQEQAQLQRDFDYYEKITTHDSSLSRSIFSILASRLRLTDKAYDYYMDTALMDLVDLQGNAKDGLHEANLGGSWLGLTYGFSGLYVSDGKLHLSNQLPEKIDELVYRIRFQKRLLEIQLHFREIKVVLIEGQPLTVVINGKTKNIN
ncbi:glycoside hydrolase family 65 protein [Lactiplantibacillus dongliensis]|uniref:Glycoside hydrolase family 65 protein n=1 Tax=Lactiplantibacillus dongliensis TaxID=2559919 RepID=A0ABW1R899_9LACO|nr:glycosyl hydrolase family 65 protein [Lactiplantibacillus dongliensis]